MKKLDPKITHEAFTAMFPNMRLRYVRGAK